MSSFSLRLKTTGNRRIRWTRAKQITFDAYKQVKANKGSAGIDGVDFDEFEVNLKNNLYKIWNRMSSGSYFPSPVMAVEIPKKSGGTRRLGIPTIADRIAQMVVKMYIEPLVEPIFHNDSYGYRSQKSALDAVGQTRKKCWKYDYVVEFDIRGLFDNIDYELLMKAVKRHVKEKWIQQYILRWLRAPFALKNGSLIERESGTPQGGVISPLLANLFLHSQKIKIVYCKDKDRRRDFTNVEFDFLGYTFKGVCIKSRTGNVGINFIASASKKANKMFRAKIKALEIHKKTGSKINMIAELLNPIVRGWVNYFAKYNKSAIRYSIKCVEIRIVKWAMCKFKRFRGHKQRAEAWLKEVRKREPKLFEHWKHANRNVAG